MRLLEGEASSLFCSADAHKPGLGPTASHNILIFLTTDAAPLIISRTIWVDTQEQIGYPDQF